MILAAFAVPHPPLILEEVGGKDTEAIATTIASYKEIARISASLHPDTVIICSPHTTIYRDYFQISGGGGASGDFGAFRAPQAKVQATYDAALVREIEEVARLAGVPAGTLGEKSRALDHATMIPLRFLQREQDGFQVVRLGFSGLPALDHYRYGVCIRQAAENLGRRVVFVASGDLSHKLKTFGPYGFAPEGPVYDEMVQKVFRTGDFLTLLAQKRAFCEAAGECGQKSFEIMAGVLDGLKVRPELLSYEGPFGVGYAVASFIPEGEDASRRFAQALEDRQAAEIRTVRDAEDPYVRLARRTVEAYIATGSAPRPEPGLPSEMLERRAGVFVSLHLDGELRGCIGTTGPTKASVADEIVANAISASTRDPRFEPVREDELPRLVYSVDVLGPNEEVASVDDLDAKRYGVIVEKGFRRGLLLPDLEGVDTPQDQISIAKRKAGLAPSDEVRLYRFEVVRHH